MKKKYINPKMEIVEIKNQQLLAGSLPTGSTLTDPGLSDSPEFDFEYNFNEFYN